MFHEKLSESYNSETGRRLAERVNEYSENSHIRLKLTISQ